MLKPFNGDLSSLASRFLHAKATPTPGYLVKRVGIWREVGDEGVTRLVVGSDLQVLLLANLHQPPDRTISLPVTPGSGIRIQDPGWGKQSGYGMNIPDHIFGNLETIFWVKNT
jgi:hypothetical protein